MSDFKVCARCPHPAYCLNRDECYYPPPTEFDRLKAQKAAILAQQEAKELKFLRAEIERLTKALNWIEYEAGQYSDGAEDAHYLARVLLQIEAVATNAELPPDAARALGTGKKPS